MKRIRESWKDNYVIGIEDRDLKESEIFERFRIPNAHSGYVPVPTFHVKRKTNLIHSSCLK